jgi:hypothetical protein
MKPARHPIALRTSRLLREAGIDAHVDESVCAEMYIKGQAGTVAVTLPRRCQFADQRNTSVANNAQCRQTSAIGRMLGPSPRSLPVS